MTSTLFSPLAIRDLELENRIVVSPMCQYSADDGVPTDWHVMHLGQFLVGGFGLVFTEATGVESRGRITPYCTGLYTDEQERAFARITAFARSYGNAPIGIQLAHAGRKASTEPPWAGGAPIPRGRGGYEAVAPSAIPYRDDWPVPRALDLEGLSRIRESFVQAAERAVRAGFDVIELHFAHGYLMHEFLSPLSNHRNDGYGGDYAGRMRFPLEVFEAVRAALPREMPLGVRISATDHVEGGWDVDEAVRFVAALAERGLDFIDVSSGGLSPDQKLALGPGYQVPFAKRIREETGVVTMAVGLISGPQQAEEIVREGHADLVAIGRGALYNPHWAWTAADALGGEHHFPTQYGYAVPERWRARMQA